MTTFWRWNVKITTSKDDRTRTTSLWFSLNQRPRSLQRPLWPRRSWRRRFSRTRWVWRYSNYPNTGHTKYRNIKKSKTCILVSGFGNGICHLKTGHFWNGWYHRYKKHQFWIWGKKMDFFGFSNAIKKPGHLPTGQHLTILILHKFGIQIIAYN